MTERTTPLGRTASLALFAGVALGVVAFEAMAQGPAEGGALERIYGPYAPVVWGIAMGLLPVAIVCLVALPFQVLYPAVRRRPKILTYEFWLDVLYASQGIWLAFASFYVLTGWMVDKIYAEGPYFSALAAIPVWLQVLLSVWLFDLLVYWRHRLEHAFPVLWSYHAVHHTTEQVDPLTTLRVHPLELVAGVLVNAAVFRLGFSPAAAALGFSIYLYYNYFIHANVRLRFPGFLKYVLVSPFMHQWHHAKINRTGNNYAVVFAWNDWLFGTAYHPAHYPTEFGMDVPPAERVGQSYIRQLLYPLQYGWARLRAARAPVVDPEESRKAAI